MADVPDYVIFACCQHVPLVLTKHWHVAVLLAAVLQVAELESVFQLLRQEVERLFLQAPSVDLDALGLQLNEAEGIIDEQGSIVQVSSAIGSSPDTHA